MDKITQKVILRTVRQLLADPNHWMKYYLAKDEHDRPVYAYTPGATKWCLAGAIQRATFYGGAPNVHLYYETLDYLNPYLPLCHSKKIGFSGVVDFNDDPETTHQMVLDLLDKALKELEE